MRSTFVAAGVVVLAAQLTLPARSEERITRGTGGHGGFGTPVPVGVRNKAFAFSNSFGALMDAPEPFDVVGTPPAAIGR